MYVFEPYNWGPYSRELAAEVRALESERLIRTKRVRAAGYPSYCLTPEGEDLAHQMRDLLGLDELRFLSSVRRYVTTKDFDSLLREVYAAYPAFASNPHWSVAR